MSRLDEILIEFDESLLDDKIFMQDQATLGSANNNTNKSITENLDKIFSNNVTQNNQWNNFVNNNQDFNLFFSNSGLQEESDVEIKDIFITTSATNTDVEINNKKKNLNEDIFLRDTCEQDTNNRTAIFLAKINAHITNNLTKSLNGSSIGGGYQVQNHEENKKDIIDNTDYNNFVQLEENLNAHSDDFIDDENENYDHNKVPEDNVERLRNIRDMFENTDQTDEQLQLQKVEKLQPSEKIKNIFLNNCEFTDMILNTNNENESNNKKNEVFDSLEDLNQNNVDKNINHNDNLSTRSNSPSSVSSLSSQSTPSYSQENNINNDDKDIIERNDSSFTFNNNNNRFEDGVNEDGEIDENGKKKEPVVVFTELNSVKTKFENIVDVSNNSIDGTPKPIRSITPPRDDIDKGEIENKPMERPVDVVSSLDKTQEILPESGLARSRKEMFQQVATPTPGSDQKRVKSITPPREDKRVLKEKTPERNENVIREADKNDEILPSAGSAKQTAAIFATGTSLTKSIERSGITIEGELTEKGIAKSRLALFSNLSTTPTTQAGNSNEIENVSGIAKERLSLFKNLEQQQQPNTRTSPPKEIKKLKEFTPPPQLDTQQRQYIIIDKDSPIDNGEIVKETQKLDEFVPEAGLAKNRMKQYLETASHQKQNGESQQNGSQEEQLPEKGIARSLLAKWKSIENLKDKEPSPELSTINGGGDNLPSGIAKNLLNKWQNIESNDSRKSTSPVNTTSNEDVQIEKGFAKNVLAKFQQNVAESSTNIKKTVTPPREIISSSQNARSIYESTPAESNINSQYNNEEEVIPSPGLAKQLKSKFQTLEKESTKVETSSSKLNYVPKRFTSNDKPTSSPKVTNGKTNGASPVINTNGSSTNTSDKCCQCDKTVYAMEKIEADKKVYHKLCFKCTTCNCTLKLGNFSSINNKLYCTPHYIQLFARNGNYDEGFGLENYKRKWLNRSTNGNEPTTVS